MNRDEALNFLATLGEHIATQDCRATSDCIYQVRDGDNKTLHGAHFLTQSAADDYIERNRHNLGDGCYVYVDSGYRNPEWQALRAACLAVYESHGGDRHLRRFSLVWEGPQNPEAWNSYETKLYNLPDVAKAWACKANVGDGERFERGQNFVTVTRTA